MPERTRPTRAQSAPTADERIDDLLDRVEKATVLMRDLVVGRLQLQDEVATLKEQLATEVRTRRLVVVDGAGEEWIRAEAQSEYATLRISTPEATGKDADAVISLLVTTEDEERPQGGAFLWSHGKVVADFTVTADDGYSALSISQPDEDGRTGLRLDHRGLVVD